MYGWVRFRMSNDADAEDVVAEAFLKAARSFRSFDPNRAKFGTWVTAIARNCMISHFRKEHPTSSLEDASEINFAAPGEQEASDDRIVVKNLIGCLGDDERELVVLKYRDGLRNVDIAAALGVNPSTVSTKLARALGKMRAQLEGAFDGRR